MQADIRVSEVYEHPIDDVWRALTTADALADWLMPNDFVLEQGHEFAFRTDPAPGFDGVVRCRVLELDPPHRMVWSWAGGPIDTTVTFTLEALGPRRTRLDMRQQGFHGLRGALTRLILRQGSRGIYRELLPNHLDRRAGRPVGALGARRHRGWRAYLGVLRPWRAVPKDPVGRRDR